MLKMVISSIKYLDKGWLIAEHPLGHLGDTGIPSMPCRHWGWLGRVKLRSAVCLSQQKWGPPVGWPLLHFQIERDKGPALQVHSLAPPSRTSAREEVQHFVLPGTWFFPFLLLTSHQNQKGWPFFSLSFLTPSYIINSTFHWSYLTCSFLWSYKVEGKVRRRISLQFQKGIRIGWYISEWESGFSLLGNQKMYKCMQKIRSANTCAHTHTLTQTV